MLKPNDKILSEILITKGLLVQEDLEKFSSKTQSTQESLGDYLIRSGPLTKDQILSTLAGHFNLPKVDLKTADISKAVFEKIPVRFVWYYKFLPIKIENKILTLAVAFPLDVKVQDEIRVHLGFEPKIVLAAESDILESIKKYYGLAAETIDRIMTKDPDHKSGESQQQHEVQDLEKQSEDASVVKLVNQIILEAYKKRATDIHIEPYRNKVRFRYRIDGVLVDANLPPEIKHFILPVLSRIKIIANLSIVEKRLPQDGSAVVKTKDQTLDLRISTIPTPHGESMVIRILPTKVMLFSLEKLGLHSSHVKIFRDLIKKPHGIIFVTGPTGSGKTTTLYACLNEINSYERKVITIEDPVEYEMEGITQIQVNLKVNLDFATGLRSVLRHDPDIIMVGEVRDLETAEIAIRTALTGHLVFSTLHTNDAASGITRLIDMGVESYLVASSVEAFVAQRLVRIICPNCKEAVSGGLVEIRKEIAEALKIKNPDEIKIYRGKGCDHCNHTGFYGRAAIHEIMVINDVIRAAILEKPRADYIKRIAIKQGMTTLRQDGWRKVVDGMTTSMEVMNVTSKEELPFENGEPSKQEDNKSFAKTVVNPAPQQYRTLPRELLSVKNEYDSRAYSRITEKVKIRYKIFHQEKNEPHSLTISTDEFEHSTVTKDLSAGGLLFIAGHALSVGTILELKIHLLEGSASIDCLAKVCRVEEDELNNMFRIAVYYLDIASADRAKINEFVKSKMLEKESLK